IKLDAIDSTNSFLKELAQNSLLEDYTVVVTDKQISGRGQMNNSWHSEPFKNLTFSTLVNLKSLEIEHQSYLNLAVSLAVFDALNSMSVPNLSIKWPNDIMSGNHKICGILVETTFAQRKIKNAIIGIGLNVHQEKFTKDIKNASSLKNLMHQDFNLDEIRNHIIKQLQIRICAIENSEFQKVYNEYHNVLYKKGIPSAFLDIKTQLFFMGIIQGVSTSGNLQIQLEDDSLVEYEVKEISFAKS
ncbi:MAG: biotin--[acetyl-CoA-carboxylase] ligase, partial [Flavobacteriaceae bacterium]|nr:biotin--[acetyl-CoA-carboxylase] ligase [Flavobacteriaceae bacterium]